jgi:histidinol dehydrogenase
MQRETIFLHRQKFLERLQDVELFQRTLAEINAIQQGREAAILSMYERKGIRRTTVAVSSNEVQEGLALIDGRDLAALEELKMRCERIARLEKKGLAPDDTIILDDSDSFYSFIMMRPLQAIGISIPERMPSSLILYCSLAVEAGVGSIMLALPPQQDGRIAPGLLAAASLFPGVSIIACGGRSAFPALAFGLAGQVPDKLFGPCGFFVDYTKQLLAMIYKIPVDLPAGPSELIVYVDNERDVQQAACDVRAQMEHGEDSVCFVLSTSNAILTTLRAALQDISSQVEYIPVEDAGEAADVINSIAPEILEVFSATPEKITRRLEHVGNVYVNMCSAAGDYCLCGKGCADPTYGMASGVSGLTIASFYRQCCVSTGLQRPDIPVPWLTRLPALEKLPHHRRAIQTYLSLSDE